MKTLAPLRILIWGNTFPCLGGVERFVDVLAHGIHARGHTLVVLSDGKSVDVLTDRPFPIKTIPMTVPIFGQDPLGILTSASEARNFIEQFEPDVIHYNSSAVEMPIFVMSAMKMGIPIVKTLHSDLGNRAFLRKDGTFSKIVAASTRITTVSQHVHSLVPKVACLQGRTVQLIENSLPSDTSYVRPARRKRIFCLGRLVPEKGFDVLVSAMKIVVQTHADATLIIGGMGPEMESLKAQIVDLGLAKTVSLAGWILPDDVMSKMQEADIVAFPSRWEEPFGLVAIEAALAGRCCVASDVGGISKNIETGVTGELVPPENAVVLAERLNVLLSDPEVCETQGRKAYDKYRSEGKFERMLDEYEQLFQDIAQASS
jgi:glycogen(starch) synthase